MKGECENIQDEAVSTHFKVIHSLSSRKNEGNHKEDNASVQLNKPVDYVTVHLGRGFTFTIHCTSLWLGDQKQYQM